MNDTEVGAGMNRDHPPMELPTGSDPRHSTLDDIRDRFDPTMGRMPEMLSSVAGNFLDLADVMTSAAKAVDKINSTGGANEGLSTDGVTLGGNHLLVAANGEEDMLDASSSVAKKPLLYTDHSRMMDALSWAFANQIAGSIYTKAGQLRTLELQQQDQSRGEFDMQALIRDEQKSMFENNDTLFAAAENVSNGLIRWNEQKLPALEHIHDLDWNTDIQRLTGNEVFDADVPPKAQNGGMSDDKFNVSFHAFNNSAAPRNLSSKDHIFSNYFDKLHDHYANIIAEDQMAAEGSALSGTNREMFGQREGGFHQVSDLDEDSALNHRIDNYLKFFFNRDVSANEGGMEEVRANNYDLNDPYSKSTSEGFASDNWKFNTQDNGMERFASQGLPEGIAVDEVVGKNPQFDGMNRLIGLMLKNAERILLKPASIGGEGRSNTGADNDRNKGQEALIAADDNWNGPSRHRNDAIHTAATGAPIGTLMPIVPTSGTRTRTPPLPGQRNLP